MSYLFSPRYKAIVFRKLWIALAEAQQKLGLPIKAVQIQEMKRHLSNIDWEAIAKHEKTTRHDVMAHILAFGDLCPKARPIIHWGATSTYVTDNGELIQMKEALGLLIGKLLVLLRAASELTLKHAHDPCLGYTHYQSAQPTTIGKRISLWVYDLWIDLQEWIRLEEMLPMLGVKGATGTQSSFLELLNQSHTKVGALEKKIASEFGFERVVDVCGQTYSRKWDALVLNALATFASGAHKMATDIRLLAHDKEMTEHFDASQVGSSAMPYKQNPIYSERVCGIARFVMTSAQNGLLTASTQWLERTLDDSSNRRLAIPDCFLGADAILNLLIHIVDHLHINSKLSVEKALDEMPKLVTENLLMAAVKKGGDRQQLHAKLKQLHAKTARAKKPLAALLDAVATDKDFGLTKKEAHAKADIAALIGRAPEQVELFIQKEVKPLLKKYAKKVGSVSPISV
ncbi:MAG: hypothetical protein RL235_131 [Chlamydiota bacterium]|jgi:adenylosuccinate lyase